MKSFALVLLFAATAAAQTAPAPADTSETRRFLDELQRLDDAFFDEETQRVDTSLRDSLLTEFETLGFAGYRDAADASQRRFRWDVEPTSPLWNYNRVEGLVPALRLEVQPFGPRSLRLLGDAGWATGPGALRWQATAQYPLTRTTSAGRGLFVFARWSDRVVPYGSNRPYANSLRALVGAADEQDYLRSRGGDAGLTWRTRRAAASLRYAATREMSTVARANFAFFDDLVATNPAVDGGIDRAIEARLRWNTQALAAWSADLGYRVAGGALGGDFDYGQLDATLRRRLHVGRWELQTTARWIGVFGDAPRQRLADAGGISSVRGVPRRARVGDAALHLRGELPLPYDVLRLSRIPYLRSLGVQFVPWADAARVDDAAWIHSVGCGIQRHWIGFGRAANLRLDVAFPIGPQRPADVVFLVRFAGS